MKIIHHQTMKSLYFKALMRFFPMFLSLSTRSTWVPISILLVQNRFDQLLLSQNLKYLQIGLVKRWITMVSCRAGAQKSTNRSFVHSEIPGHSATTTSKGSKGSKGLILSRNSELKGPQYLRRCRLHGGASALVLQKTPGNGKPNEISMKSQ